MSRKLSKIHLSQVRTFHFSDMSSEPFRKFEFLADNKDYFENVVENITHLREKKYNVSEVGKMRSVLDYDYFPADPFFEKLQRFYKELYRNNVILTPHYPCAIDILPSKNKNYQIVQSTLPGSLADSDPQNTKISLSMRIYPVGVASFRIGCFLSTSKSFETKDIIDFLYNRRTKIQVGKETLDLNELGMKYAKKLTSGLIQKGPPPFRFSETYNIIDIVEASGLLPLEQSYNDVFLPLLTFQKETGQEENIGPNLSEKGDVMLIGEKSAVFHFPSTYTEEKTWDRRRVRRWLKNFVELYASQRYLTSQARPDEMVEAFGLIKEKFWDKWGKALFTLKINSIFSRWIYTQLHEYPSTLGNKNWRNRYLELLKVLDEEGRIKKAKKSAANQLMSIREDSKDAEKSLGKFLKQAITLITEIFSKF